MGGVCEEGERFWFWSIDYKGCGKAFFHDPMWDIGVLGESSKMSY